MNGVIEPLERIDGAAPAVPSPYARSTKLGDTLGDARRQYPAMNRRRFLGGNRKADDDHPEVWGNHEIG